MATKRTGCKKPRNVGKMEPLNLYTPPLYKKPITKAEEKFMKGVKIDPYACLMNYPGGNCNGVSVTINKTSSTPVIRALSRSPDNATVKSIQAGMTRNADGSTTLTMDAWNKFQKAVNAKRPDIFVPVKWTTKNIGSCGCKGKKPKKVGNYKDPVSKKRFDNFNKNVSSTGGLYYIEGSSAKQLKAWEQKAPTATIVTEVKKGTTVNKDGSLTMTTTAWNQLNANVSGRGRYYKPPQ